MIVYTADKNKFRQDILNGKLISSIQSALKNNGIGYGSSEICSWNSSLSYMDRVIEDKDIPNNAGVAIEYVIPGNSKRLDFLISGYDQTNESNLVIIELKQWQKANVDPNKKDVITTYVGGGERQVAHPSYQAYSYGRLLYDFCEVVRNKPVNIKTCAFLHNYLLEEDDPIINPKYSDVIKSSPLYGSQDAQNLRNFIKDSIKKGDDVQIIHDIDSGKIRPSKSLQDSISSMLDGNEEFVLIDEQKVVFERAINLAEKCIEDGKKRTLIVQGGPGTGKSVVAIRLLAELIKKELNTRYITKTSATRNVYQSKLMGSNKDIGVINLFVSSETFHSKVKDFLDVAIVDESHRLVLRSGYYQNMGENQVQEIIRASKFSVFFIDENQIVHAKDVGTIEEIKASCQREKSDIYYDELPTQFRCNGSDGYLSWLDDLLQIKKTANPLFEADYNYDFDVVDSPSELFEWVKQKNEGRNRSRLLAGYCWEWNSKSDYRVNDININDFSMQWNFKNTKTWAIDFDSINQIGCVHTSQGLEFDYVGVIIGDDLRFEDNVVKTDFKKRAKSDRSLYGLKTKAHEEIRNLTFGEASKKIDLIIRNTYRTLMTRGMKGCRVYCTNKNLAQYFKLRLGKYKATSQDVYETLKVAESKTSTYIIDE
ncbi:DUF2075 domain-containing protein [Taylorella equigenitalis]|uniref:Schlafen group 3-like DNA/RNA helicase domain-containing protein n=1 Tax=Taylorella equigenitalis 14/56 TaxID=1091497 RepID=I7JP51_9BURK|nr:DUF2075 domain-containing protein [Taylorella equigenitalis]ASY30406.1 ATP-binding protein [Taylorella equigenitalis]KOS58422.1 ATP-binding protein [Taylorella equigenitalis]WDU48479.1 DUF2075 domain-containing protein [Taylorella equigenitalis]WDU49994.1 DUF2075 domain-containing protein [Taylorella equigenitalis]WDU52467.1 DUF2075 domain-containing protein [Taylorella equigenitalis]